MQFTSAGTTVLFDEETLRFALRREDADGDVAQWSWRDGSMPTITGRFVHDTADGTAAGEDASTTTAVGAAGDTADAADDTGKAAEEHTFAFTDAAEITHELRKTGTGEGVFSTYRGFTADATSAADTTSAAGTDGDTTSGSEATTFAFATYVWVEQVSGDVRFEWIPLDETGFEVTKLTWPGEMAFDALDEHDVTLITHQQGVLIPNTWPVAVSSTHGDIVFKGRFETAGGYMPWYAQIRGGSDANRPGYIAICETPWNAGYEIEHPANGVDDGTANDSDTAAANGTTVPTGTANNVSVSPSSGSVPTGTANTVMSTEATAERRHLSTAIGTRIGMWFEPSLGRMSYRRIVRYRFLDHADHTSVAKTYRAYVNERGRLRTLAEKAARNPSVRDLIGCSWMHVGIKTVVQPESRYYDHEHPELNQHVTSFAARRKQLDTLHELGAGRIYMHLDGWAEPGYDNSHPDYLPACEEAGGWAGMKALVDDCHAHGDLFGTHDQYRDYYFSAPTFNRNNAVQLTDGTNPEQSIWAGGHQTFLCAELAPDYVRRNFAQIAANGVKLDCAYLDVFTCNEGDECANPEHRMTRRDCYVRRAECFEYLLSHGILSSSEEVSDWAVPSLVFCHYAPYDFQMRDPSAPRQGVPVPLYNLVYHDCVIEPWMMERVAGGDDYMLYALINGGAPYLIRDAAYVGVDGDMSPEQKAQAENDIERCNTVAALHEKVGMSELIRHDFVGGDPLVQRSTFADGTVVTCDFHTQTYAIR
ncbi:DUF5696 domain-containing protein [Bifidobacterium sp. SO1]|uniref:DUF5696 domain-containing protein n=1 Tax=Bifidobacterium sp. SO1 TaxID=2809029 RepID=UPI003204A415